MDLSICENVMCSVYVYGASSPACPRCSLEGRKMNKEQAAKFAIIYREVQK